MLVYDGILARETREACLDAADRGYRFAIEVDQPPPAEWTEALAKRTWQQRSNSTSCSHDDTFERTGKLYVGVRRDAGYPYPMDASGRYNGGMFLFLLDAADHQAALEVLDHVASSKPFKTILGVLDA